MDREELASSLRAWRERLAPEDAGLPARTRRRTPGLRREEVAQLAGVSVDYVVRLEQARGAHPSPSVLLALARALRLTDDEQAHLMRVAGHAVPGPGRMVRHLTPGVQRILDRLADVPVTVLDAAWYVVAWNDMAAALLGDYSALEPRERNLLVRWFGAGSSRIARTAEDEARFEVEAVSDLRAALGRYPDDPDLRALVAELRASSPRFTALWDEHPVSPRVASRKTIDHPEVGPVTVDCDVLRVEGSDLRLVVYTAAPGSPDAEALRLLGVVGLQTL